MIKVSMACLRAPNSQPYTHCGEEVNMAGSLVQHERTLVYTNSLSNLLLAQ